MKIPREASGTVLVSAHLGRKWSSGGQNVVSGLSARLATRSFLLCFLLVLLVLPLRAADEGAKLWHATPNLSMGTHDIDLGGHCWRMTAAIVDSSLAKLRKKRSAAGTEFHRGKNVVDRFPDELMVELSVTDCASPYAVPVRRNILASMQFEAQWRRGSEERPVSGLYVPRMRSTEGSPEPSDTIQIYELSIQSADVPLTDQLVLRVSSADGKKIAEFVAGL
jgi:hypothetical protein